MRENLLPGGCPAPPPEYVDDVVLHLLVPDELQVCLLPADDVGQVALVDLRHAGEALVVPGVVPPVGVHHLLLEPPGGRGDDGEAAVDGRVQGARGLALAVLVLNRRGGGGVVPAAAAAAAVGGGQGGTERGK